MHLLFTFLSINCRRNATHLEEKVAGPSQLDSQDPDGTPVLKLKHQVTNIQQAPIAGTGTCSGSAASTSMATATGCKPSSLFVAIISRFSTSCPCSSSAVVKGMFLLGGSGSRANGASRDFSNTAVQFTNYRFGEST